MAGPGEVAADKDCMLESWRPGGNVAALVSAGMET